MISINDDILSRLEARSYDISKEPLTNLPPICIPNQNSIISLDAAIEPLISLLPNLQTFVFIAKEKCQNPCDNLTQDESASIMLYSMDWKPMDQCLYYVLNSTLRSDDRQKLKPWFFYLTLFMKALSRLPSISISVYRQVEINLIERYSLEKIFLWWSFSLCRLSLEKIQLNKSLTKSNSHTLFTIECHTGKDIRKHSYFTNEDQILLMAASQFKVVSSFTNDDGQHEIHLKQIPLINPLLQFVKISNTQEIVSRDLYLNLSNTNIQSRLKVETIQKYINRLLKLQTKIDRCPLHSSIDLTNENLDDQDISLVIQHAIIKKQCTILRLDKNFLTEQGITILVNSLDNNTTLIGLNLYSNRLFDKGIHPLGKLLSVNHSVLQKLHLGSNKISNEGARLIAQMLKTNKTLNVLWLDNNQITDQGVHLLSDALIHHNRTLTELSLKKNKLITSLSIQDFRNIFIHNQSLIQLDLSNCNLTKEDNLQLRNACNQNKQFILRLDTQEDDCVIT